MPGLKMVAELGGDGRGFEKMMDGASSVADGLGAKLAGLFSIGAITAFTKSTIDWAGSLQDVADGLEVNVEWFQKMANGAATAGGKIEDLEKFLGDITKSRSQAVAGGHAGDKKAAAFGRLGISSSDISTLNTEAFFKKLMERFKDGMDAQGQVDLREVGGKSARALAAAFANQFQSDAPILSADMVSQLDAVGDAFTDIATTLKVTFAPVIIMVGNLLNWFREGFELIAVMLGNVSQAMNQLMSGDFKGAVQTIKATKDEIHDLNEQHDKQRANRAAARAAAVDASNKRASGSPDFGSVDGTGDSQTKKTTKAKGLEVDSFARAGRFMGNAGNAVNYVANQQLQVAREQLTEQKRMADALQKIAFRAISNAKYDINSLFPPAR